MLGASVRKVIDREGHMRGHENLHAWEGAGPGSGGLSHAIGQLGEGYRGCGVQLPGSLGGHLTSHMDADIVCDAAVYIFAHLHLASAVGSMLACID